MKKNTSLEFNGLSNMFNSLKTKQSLNENDKYNKIIESTFKYNIVSLLKLFENKNLFPVINIRIATNYEIVIKKENNLFKIIDKDKISEFSEYNDFFLNLVQLHNDKNIEKLKTPISQTQTLKQQTTQLKNFTPIETPVSQTLEQQTTQLKYFTPIETPILQSQTNLQNLNISTSLPQTLEQQTTQLKDFTPIETPVSKPQTNLKKNKWY